jgi:hypothetical protein
MCHIDNKKDLLYVATYTYISNGQEVKKAIPTFLWAGNEMFN